MSYNAYDYPAANGGIVTERITRICAEIGHATHLVEGADTGTCARCGEVTSVVAEDAPIGVQLWPTISPGYADNFTLMEVQTVRGEIRSYARWIYRNGSERTFSLGERVAVQLVK